MTTFALYLFPALAIAAFLGCLAAIPLCRKLFLAEPNERSSHSRATPQGGGLVVIPLSVLGFFLSITPSGSPLPAALALCLFGLMILGALDDRFHLPARLRFALQLLAAAALLAAAPEGWRNWLPMLPAWLAFGALLIAIVWFVNLTNFMDGIDLMTVANFVPALLLGFLLLRGEQGAAFQVGALSLAAAAALVGFAGVNRPVASMFMGDSGSLPLGLIGAALMLALAARYGAIAAVLPFLYPIADATFTLLRRAYEGKIVWQAHREHFYQQATTNGLSVRGVIARVLLLNVALCLLTLRAAQAGALEQAVLLALGLAGLSVLIRDFRRPRT